MIIQLTCYHCSKAIDVESDLIRDMIRNNETFTRMTAHSYVRENEHLQQQNENMKADLSTLDKLKSENAAMFEFVKFVKNISNNLSTPNELIEAASVLIENIEFYRGLK